MRFFTTLVFVMAFCFFAIGQQKASEQFGVTTGFNSNTKSDKPLKQVFTFEKQATVDYKTIGPDYNPALLIREMPKQGSKKKEVYSYPKEKWQLQNGSNSKSNVLPIPEKADNFFANPWGVSTPNDNDMAISDSGFVVSVANTNIFIKNVKTGISPPVKSLASFSSPLGISAFKFDPKVVYDPVSDRFVMVFLAGSTDANSKVILAFSSSSDPTSNWHLYSLPGDPLNNNLWTDYPMLAVSEKEVFLTVNLLHNDSSWQTGFVETLVWQINKEKGYNGATLSTHLHSNIKFSGKAIRNLCPVKGGSKPYGPNMYFVSNRNLASINDTVFLVNITDTINAPSNGVTAKALTSSQAYYFPPDGRQSAATQSLATNDCRNLGAFYENGIIHYVHNSMHPVNNRAAIYYGTIQNVGSVSPSVDGYFINNDSTDFAYPNISYAGLTSTDNSAIVNFNHSSAIVHPGCSVVMADGTGNFSTPVTIKNGINHIDILQSNLERWGDYSGSQRRYGNAGEVWICGYYGYYYSSAYPRAHGTWVAQVFTNERFYLNTTKILPETNESVKVFPNPSEGLFTVDLELKQPELLSFELYDVSGKKVALLLEDWVSVKQNMFAFSTKELEKGIYFLKIEGNKNTHITRKVIIR